MTLTELNRVVASIPGLSADDVSLVVYDGCAFGGSRAVMSCRHITVLMACGRLIVLGPDDTRDEEQVELMLLPDTPGVTLGRNGRPIDRSGG